MTTCFVDHILICSRWKEKLLLYTTWMLLSNLVWVAFRACKIGRCSNFLSWVDSTALHDQFSRDWQSDGLQELKVSPLLENEWSRFSLDISTLRILFYAKTKMNQQSAGHFLKILSHWHRLWILLTKCFRSEPVIKTKCCTVSKHVV